MFPITEYRSRSDRDTDVGTLLFHGKNVDVYFNFNNLKCQMKKQGNNTLR